MLFEAWDARCSPNLDLGRTQNNLLTADLTIPVQVVENFSFSV